MGSYPGATPQEQPPTPQLPVRAPSMPTLKLTQLAVDRLKPPSRGRLEYWDAQLPGFGLRISAPRSGSKDGRRTWQAMYRVNGKLVRETLGAVAVIPKVDDARACQGKHADGAIGRSPGRGAPNRRGESSSRSEGQGSCPKGWCKSGGVYALSGEFCGFHQAATAGSLKIGSSLNGAMVSRVM